MPCFHVRQVSVYMYWITLAFIILLIKLKIIKICYYINTELQFGFLPSAPVGKNKQMSVADNRFIAAGCSHLLH